MLMVQDRKCSQLLKLDVCTVIRNLYIVIFSKANNHALVNACKFNSHCSTANIDQNNSIFVYFRSLEHQNLCINFQKRLQLPGDFSPQYPYRGFAPGPH